MKHKATPMSFESLYRKMAKQRRSKDELCDMGLRSLVHSRPAEIERYEDEETFGVAHPSRPQNRRGMSVRRF